MKNRIPPDVERLMWLTVESNDQDAVQDFLSRFPHLRQELATRQKMVSELKGAKLPSQTERQIPRFEPRSNVSMGPSKGTLIVGGLAFAALAVASYSVTQYVMHPTPKLPVVQHVPTDPVKPKDDVIYVTPNNDQKVTPQVLPHDPNDTPPVQPPIAQGDMPKDLKIPSSPLTAVLRLIGERAGYRVEIAPGFEEKTVSIDYTQMTAAEMLKDLGREHGFTAFDQGDGTIIIVPAVDTGAPTGQDSDSSTRHIGG